MVVRVDRQNPAYSLQGGAVLRTTASDWSYRASALFWNSLDTMGHEVKGTRVCNTTLASSSIGQMS
jgi:hypothetical protein